MTDTCRLFQNALKQWIIVRVTPPQLGWLDFAWTGSRWAPVNEAGLPAGDVQISNFPTVAEAATEAIRRGFAVSPMIAQDDDPELLEWLVNAHDKAGSFVSNLAAAALVADFENYPILRPVLVLMRAKYRQYEPTDAVKAEIARRPK